MPNVISNLKAITSGNIPTTSNLPQGYAAFGLVGGVPKLYGNADGVVREYGGSGGDEDYGVTDVTYNGATQTFTITYADGSTNQFSMPADNFLSDVQYDSGTGEVTFTMTDESTFSINISALIDVYEASADGGLELVDGNKFGIKAGGVSINMLEQSLKTKIVNLYPEGDGTKVLTNAGTFETINLVVGAI